MDTMKSRHLLARQRPQEKPICRPDLSLSLRAESNSVCLTPSAALGYCSPNCRQTIPELSDLKHAAFVQLVSLCITWAACGPRAGAVVNVWFSEGQLNNPQRLVGSLLCLGVGCESREFRMTSARTNGGLSAPPSASEPHAPGWRQRSREVASASAGSASACVLTANRPLAKAGSRVRGATSHVPECGDR